MNSVLCYEPAVDSPEPLVEVRELFQDSLLSPSALVADLDWESSAVDRNRSPWTYLPVAARAQPDVVEAHHRHLAVWTLHHGSSPGASSETTPSPSPSC